MKTALVVAILLSALEPTAFGFFDSAGTPAPLFPKLALSSEPRGPGRVSGSTRREAMLRGEVWLEPGSFPALPKSPAGPGGELVCDYDQERTYKSRLGGGATPKFYCALPTSDAGQPGVLIRVKYSLPGKPNGEVFAQTAASALFQALGFGANASHSVTIRCRHCPEDPWQFSDRVTNLRGTPRQALKEEVVFPNAAVGFVFPGAVLAEKSDQGWSWKELAETDPARPHLKVHRDALKLLVAFVQHGDNKSEQQRLICLEPPISDGGALRCATPFLYVSDLGATFGGAGSLTTGSSKMSLEKWIKRCVWDDPRILKTRLNGSNSGTMSDPVVGEEGRAFLAELLGGLSPEQVRGFFETARVDVLHRERERGVTADHWTAAFLIKSREVAEKRCLDSERDALLKSAGLD